MFRRRESRGSLHGALRRQLLWLRRALPGRGGCIRRLGIVGPAHALGPARLDALPVFSHLRLRALQPLLHGRSTRRRRRVRAAESSEQPIRRFTRRIQRLRLRRFGADVAAVGGVRVQFDGPHAVMDPERSVDQPGVGRVLPQ